MESRKVLTGSILKGHVLQDLKNLFWSFGHRLRRRIQLLQGVIEFGRVDDDDLFPQRLLKAGAMGYVTKGAKVDEIVRAIHDVMANRRYITPEIAQQIALSQFDGEQGSPFDSLSERELQVLLMLMDGQTVSVISAKLCLSPKTVSTYRARLYSKLGVQNDIELARLALLHGIVENTSNLNT